MNRIKDETRRAAEHIRRGALVVFPTETVYGLGADALNGTAVERIFLAKGRPADNPLIVHLAEPNDLSRVADASNDLAVALLQRFAPGPLTVVVPASAYLPRVVTAGLDTVAVRVPRHPIARDLLRLSDRPIAAPSANRSGEPSPTTVAMARRSLGDAPALYLDGGPCEVGLESTVVAVGDDVTILRPGAVSRADLAAAFPGVLVVPAAESRLDRPLSPGLRHRHYQPGADVVLFSDRDVLTRWLRDWSGEKVGVICSPAIAAGIDPGSAIVRSYRDDREYAQKLYAWFHEFDDVPVTVIAAEYPEAGGIGDALRDRLDRSSGGRRID
jgi:L-threonylcarbamoyladenylate synthase